MPKAKELPGMPKMDKSAELALDFLALKEQARELQEKIKDAHDLLAESLLQQNKTSIYITWNNAGYTIEVEHVDECDKIKVKKNG